MKGGISDKGCDTIEVPDYDSHLGRGRGADVVLGDRLPLNTLDEVWLVTKNDRCFGWSGGILAVERRMDGTTR